MPPNAQSRDLICVFDGAPAPVVTRLKKEDKKTAEQRPCWHVGGEVGPGHFNVYLAVHLNCHSTIRDGTYLHGIHFSMSRARCKIRRYTATEFFS